MPYENLRYGQRVKVGAKEGFVREAADKYKVKFDDGSFGFFDGTEISPVVDATYLKGSTKFDRMKEDSKLKPVTIMAEPTAAGEDPMAQPKRKTERGVGEEQTVLGKSVARDVFTIGKSLKSDLDELRREQDEYTTSDLQGVVYSVARRHGVDEDDCLNYIYDGDNSVFEGNGRSTLKGKGVDCRHCNGTGEADGGKCNHCDGSGTVVVKAHEEPDGDEQVNKGENEDEHISDDEADARDALNAKKSTTAGGPIQEIARSMFGHSFEECSEQEKQQVLAEIKKRGSNV